MAERTAKERQVLGTILLGVGAFAGVMAIVYLVKFMFFSIDVSYESYMTASAFAATMLFAALLGVGMNYTIRVPRGKDDDRSQIIAAIVMIFLGTAICASIQIVQGIGEYLLLPIVFYTQNWIMFLIALYSLKFYRKKK